jgi:hypothetical protein
VDREAVSNAQNAIPEQLEPRRATIKHKSIKPPSVQAAIIAKHAMGETKTQIAKDLDISRSTVHTILSSSDIEQQVLLGRSRAVSLIPKSLDVAEYRLSKNDGSMALGLLRGTQVLVNQPITANQTNIQANTWIQMRVERDKEALPLVANTDEKS